MILSDKQIEERVKKEGMISPFVPKQIKSFNGVKVVSFGLSSYGYDIRISNEFKFFPITLENSIVDPKSSWLDDVPTVKTDCCIIPPNSFVLGISVEKFAIPRDIIGLCVGKSTYARCGIIANITPLEPEWRGRIVIEISKIYAYEGIAQVIFLKADSLCRTSYEDKNGKYQDQEDIVIKV